MAERGEKGRILHVCVQERQADRQTDKVNMLMNAGVKAMEGVAIETLCFVVMVQSNAAHLSAWENQNILVIFEVCACTHLLWVRTCMCYTCLWLLVNTRVPMRTASTQVNGMVLFKVM